MADLALVEQMEACEFDMAAAGDLAGAHMMGDIIKGYLTGSTPESNARIALVSGRKRLRSSADSGEAGQ